MCLWKEPAYARWLTIASIEVLRQRRFLPLALGALLLALVGCAAAPESAPPSPFQALETLQLPPANDLNFSGQGRPVRVVRHHLPGSEFNGPLGHRWTHSYMMYVEDRLNGVVKFFHPNGYIAYFIPIGENEFESTIGDGRRLTKAADGSFRMYNPSGTRYHFNPLGTLTEIEDGDGQSTTFTHDSTGRLTSIGDSAGRRAIFAYDGSNHIQTISDTIGRSVRYVYDASENLVSVTNAGGLQTAYVYDDRHNLVETRNAIGVSEKLLGPAPGKSK